MSLLTPNLRDVGKEVNRIAKSDLLREGVLFRSGELALVRSLDEIGSPRTIINLETARDPEWNQGEVHFHFPIPDSTEVYDTSSCQTKEWLLSVVELTANEEHVPPILLHCTAGKDRTGAVVGAILAGIGISTETVLAEYELSTGPLYPEKISKLIELVSAGEILPLGLRSALRARYAKPEQVGDGKPDPVSS